MIHRNTHPPVIEGTTYRSIQTDNREYIDKLDAQGKDVYVWRNADGKVWVAYPEQDEL